ncbi:MAG: ABC transporter ATP-binding protein [Nitrospinota bacterium]
MTDGMGPAAGRDSLCLKLEGVSKHFGGLRAVNGVSLHAEGGERLAIIGPNGAGKTTLFSLITGELPLTAGRVLFFGQDVSALPPHRRAAIGMARTFQITNLFSNLSVEENLVLAAQGLERTKFSMLRPIRRFRHLYERAEALLAELGLGERRRALIKNLSHGEKRQVEVALALTGRPRMMLLDEPTAGLSAAETAQMAELLKRLDPAITLLIVEHDMDVVFELAQRIAVLHYGEVLAEGAPEAVKENPTVQEIYLGVG